MPCTRPALASSFVGAAMALATGDAAAEEGFLPSAHLGLGPGFHIEPKEERATQFTFDATAGVLYTDRTGDVFETNAFLGLEAGYAYDGLGLHAFAVTPMVGYGVPLAYLAYQPRLLVGDVDGQTAIGMRNGLAMHLFLSLGSLEIGHRFMSFAGELHHSLQLMFAVNPGIFLAAVADD